MPDIVVFDAFTFFRALAYDPEEANDFVSEKEAFDTLKTWCRHRLLISTKVQRFYDKELRKFSLDPGLLITSITDLTEAQKISQRVSGSSGNIEIKGLSKQHRELFQEAVAAQAILVICVNPGWLNNEILRNSLDSFGIGLLSPAQYANDFRMS